MIYVTGDTHGDIDIAKINTKNFPEQKNMTKDDYLIICGDVGIVWNGSNTDKHWQKWHSQKNYTTLCIDGNHENFDLLAEYPTIDKFGGHVKEIAPSVYFLERGNIFTVDGKTIWVMGGATSHDKYARIEYVSWWKQEIPSYLEMETGIKNLEKVNWKVDYVFTHSAPSHLLNDINKRYEPDFLTDYLENISKKLEFDKWFFGHYHNDIIISQIKEIREGKGLNFKKIEKIQQFYCLYNHIVKAN